MGRLSCPWYFPGKDIGVRLSFPSPVDLSDPKIKPGSPALAGQLFTTEPHGKPHKGMVNDSIFMNLLLIV